MNEQNIINSFVARLRKSGFSDLKVDQWPDKENRKNSDIDAIAGNFAIEHTSIDTLPNQRRDSNWFIKAVGEIEKELSEPPLFPFRLNITIEYAAVTKGQDWAAIRKNLKAWIINELPCLADGSQVLEGVQGVPFHLHVRKASDRHPGIFFARFEPNDDTLPKRIRKQFDRKAKKLKKYHDQYKTTVLLIENVDIALMNKFKILYAIQKAYHSGLPNNVDKIWYADTSIPDDIEFMDFTHEIVQGDKPTS
ncbi:MAG TPA: hypothetical protein ACFYD0_15900 [Candidatus Wunengus sp. YC65]|uniref:hypothetical protein n=1 Tax=Candidatus Wunengus sp. YC65 TaxID=3367701 RepID=UPI004027CDF8